MEYNVPTNETLPYFDNLTVLDSWTPSKHGIILYSYTERVVLATIFLFIAIFGTLGNSLVIIAVLLSRKLQTPPNAFVASLAVADLLTCASLTWNIVSLISFNGWPLNNAKWLCTTAGYTVLVCIGVSLFSLSAISLNRCMLITQPYRKYQRIYSSLNIGLMIAGTWVIPSFLFLSLALTGIIRFGYNDKLFLCNEFEQHQKGDLALLLVKVITTLMALLTVVASYTLVFIHVRRHFKRKREREMNSNNSHTSSTAEEPRGRVRDVRNTLSIGHSVYNTGAPNQGTVLKRENPFNRKDLEVTKNMLAIIIIFFLCFMPYAVILFIPGAERLHLYGITLVFANSSLNPIIYGLRHPHFKLVLGTLIKCRYDNIPEPAEIVKRFSSRRIEPVP